MRLIGAQLIARIFKRATVESDELDQLRKEKRLVADDVIGFLRSGEETRGGECFI